MPSSTLIEPLAATLPRTRAKDADFVARYAKLTAAAGTDVAAADWWRTGTASQDRFASTLLDRLLAGELAPAPRPSLVARLRAAAGFVARTLSRRSRARAAYPGRLPDGARSLGVTVLRTWLSPAAFDGGTYTDPYFGPLREKLLERGHRVITVAGTLASYPETLALMAAHPELEIYPEELFLTASDVTRVARRVFRARPVVSGPLQFGGSDATAAVQASLDAESAGRQVYLNELLRPIAARIEQRFELATVIATYEDLAWEKVWWATLAERSPRTLRIGYQHAPVYPAMTTFARPPLAAGPARPGPDRIVTMGAVTRDRLAEAGVPESLLVEGPSLRLVPRPPAARTSRPTGPLLVILGEFERSLRLARLIADTVAQRPGTTAVLRLHPLTPRDRFLAEMGPLPDGVTVSSAVALEADLAPAGAVAYDASSVALDALLAGVPVVHVDLGDPLSFDPLHGGAPLHWEAASPAQIADALDAIDALSDSEYVDRAQQAARVASAWFGPLDDAHLSAFEADNRKDLT